MGRKNRMKGIVNKKQPKQLKGYKCCKCEKGALHICNTSTCPYFGGTFCDGHLLEHVAEHL